MTTIRLSDDALRDLRDGYSFYEAQESGLGDYFLTCLRADIESLKVTAGSHRTIYRDYRRLLSRVFPYGVFYTCDSEFADIWAIADLRRDPEWIRQHLES